MFQVQFKDSEGKTVTLHAKDVEQDYPFVTIRGVCQENRSGLLVTPYSDDFQEYSRFEELDIPYHQILQVGKLKEVASVKTLQPRAIHPVD